MRDGRRGERRWFGEIYIRLGAALEPGRTKFKGDDES